MNFSFDSTTTTASSTFGTTTPATGFEFGSGDSAKPGGQFGSGNTASTTAPSGITALGKPTTASTTKASHTTATMDESSSSSSYESFDEEEEEEASGSSVSDEWSSTGQLPTFPFTNVGHINAGPAESPFDFFSLFFNATFMAVLVSSINTHAKCVLLEDTHDKSRIQNWKDTNVDELNTFLGLLFHMGHIKLNKINDYWKTDVLFNLPFRKFMSRDRFLLILHNFCYSDPNVNFNNNDPDRFVKPIILFFNNLMKTLVIPPKNLTIDESVVLWRDRLMYIQGKRQKYGVKLYVLTDTNGITQKMHMYCGSHDLELRRQGHVNKVVMMLMEDYLNAGYSLYMDKFYNSVSLAESLLSKKTYVTGTLRANRSRNPGITKIQLESGDMVSKYNSRGVCITNYRDIRTVLMISTEHSPDFVEYRNRRGQIKSKPNVIAQYNKYIKGVDIKDQMLSYYPCYNKSTRRYKKILLHVMQVMLLNAFLMYKKQQPQNHNTNSTMSFYDFRLEIVRQLLNIRESTDRLTNSSLSRNKITTNTGDDIHWPEELPRNDKGKIKRKDCRYCLETRNIRKAAVFYCPLCPRKPGLCLKCFRSFHNY